MDPLTHTLVGASLAATRLGAKARRATAALVIGANLPDVDVLAYAVSSDFALGFRRGWTHGVLALAVLPALLAGLLMLWDRWRVRRSANSPISAGRLLGLCYLACLTHPFLDWLNNYGMRWWMPFRETWYYGDSVFIIDPWLWSILGVGGLIAFIFRSRRRPIAAQRSATIGLLLGALYIGALISVHALTLSRVQSELREQGMASFDELLVGPAPANPLVWEIVVGAEDAYRWGHFDWRHGGGLLLSEAQLPRARNSPYWNQIVDSGQSQGFLRWVRLPWLEVEETASENLVYLMDARYVRSRRTGFGTTAITLPRE